MSGDGFRDASAKLCDLGLSAHLAAAKGARRARLAQCCGSMGFFAPEMLDESGYDGPRADAWSLGCLALECAGGSELFTREWFSAYRDFFRARPRDVRRADEADL